MISAGFPSPPLRGIDLPGPFFLAFYSLVILTGIILAVVVTSRLWKSRGGNGDDVFSALGWSVVLGIIGARIYHVATTPDAYFGEDGDLLDIIRIWEGGIGIIGAVAGGAVGVWIACRRQGMKFPAFADAAVPGVLLAQAVGRWGNWFNQELYGSTTNLPWGLQINTDQYHQALPPGASEQTLFHPTFLYESIWNLVGVIALIWLYRRFQFKQGLLVATYAAYYLLGRFWIESLRIDGAGQPTQYPLEAIGLDWRLNQIVAFVLFIAAIGVLLWLVRRRPLTDEAMAEEMEIYRPDSPQRAAPEGEGSEEHLETEDGVSDDETDQVHAGPRDETSSG